MRRPAVNELIQDPAAPFQALRAALKSEMHCALPGIVQAYDPATQTATIQPAIRNRVANDMGIENVQLPLLANVPVFFPGGGQYALTMPVQQGDECLVVFADSCIDAWWQSGGVQNQIDLRSHDISDGFAFVGFRSRAKALNGVPDSVPTVIGDPGVLKGPKGDDGKSVTSAAFSGNDLIFTLSDNSTVTISGAKVLLTGPAGSNATVTKETVEEVLTGDITTHGHSVDKISGTLPVSKGGTGQTSVAAFRNAMGLGNTTAALAVPNGGTGLSTVTAGSYVKGNGESALIPRTPAQVLADIGAAASGHTHDYSSFVHYVDSIGTYGSSNNDLDAYRTMGVYQLYGSSGAHANVGWGIMLVLLTSSYCVQFQFADSGVVVWRLASLFTNPITWTAWKTFTTT